MDLHVERIVAPSELDRLIDDHARGSDFGLMEQAIDVLGIEPDASVTDFHADAPWHVGAMNSVFGDRQIELEMSEGVVVVAAGHDVLSLAVALEVLLVN